METEEFHVFLKSVGQQLGNLFLLWFISSWAGTEPCLLILRSSSRSTKLRILLADYFDPVEAGI